MTQAFKVVLSSSRSTGASVSPLLVARTAPEGKEKQRLAMRKQVSFKTLSKLNSEDGVRELAKVWSGSNGDGEDEEEQNDHVSPLQQCTRSFLERRLRTRGGLDPIARSGRVPGLGLAALRSALRLSLPE